MAGRKNKASIEKKKKIFLDVLARTGQVKLAAQAAGWTNSSWPYVIRKKDEKFAQDWDDAEAAAVHEVLEPEAMRRAVEGVKKPIYYKGQLVGEELVYSDSLLIRLLEAGNKRKYGRQTNVNGQIDHNHKVGIAMLPSPVADVDAWEQESRRLSEEQQKTLDTLSQDGVEYEVVENRGET